MACTIMKLRRQMNIYSLHQAWQHDILSQVLVLVVQTISCFTAGLAPFKPRYRPCPVSPGVRSKPRRHDLLRHLHLAIDMATHSAFHYCRPRPAEPPERTIPRRREVGRQLLLTIYLATHDLRPTLSCYRPCPARPRARSIPWRREVLRLLPLARDLATRDLWHSVPKQQWTTHSIWLYWKLISDTWDTNWVKIFTRKVSWIVKEQLHTKASRDKQRNARENECKSNALVLVWTMYFVQILCDSYFNIATSGPRQ